MGDLPIRHPRAALDVNSQHWSTYYLFPEMPGSSGRINGRSTEKYILEYRRNPGPGWTIILDLPSLVVGERQWGMARYVVHVRDEP